MESRAHGGGWSRRTAMSNFDVLVDSDAFVGWIMPDDAHHHRVSERFERIFVRRRRLVTTSWVIAETATVLSRKAGQEVARLFLERVELLGFPVIHMSEKLQAATVELFKAQLGRNVSMVDCSNVVVMETFEIRAILSFDEFYFKRMGLKAA
jgi:predicted nucleic acid-binding protein